VLGEQVGEVFLDAWAFGLQAQLLELSDVLFEILDAFCHKISIIIPEFSLTFLAHIIMPICYDENMFPLESLKLKEVCFRMKSDRTSIANAIIRLFLKNTKLPLSITSLTINKQG
jgi:hypothetical protein